MVALAPPPRPRRAHRTRSEPVASGAEWGQRIQKQRLYRFSAEAVGLGPGQGEAKVGAVWRQSVFCSARRSLAAIGIGVVIGQGPGALPARGDAYERSLHVQAVDG